MHGLVLCLKLIYSVPPITALKDILRGQLVSITADETTDVRDRSILKLLQLSGIDLTSSLVETMLAITHLSFSQAIIQSVTDVGIVFDEVIAVVTDSAATAGKHTYSE